MTEQIMYEIDMTEKKKYFTKLVLENIITVKITHQRVGVDL
jgi:hypothetical protein